MHRFTSKEIEDCIKYEVCLRAIERGLFAKNDLCPPPSRWFNYLDRTNHRDPNFRNHPINPIYQSPTSETVSMPSGALETIIRAIGRQTRAPPPRPQVVTRYVRIPPPPIPINHGRGGFRGRGRGRRPEGNRRGRRSGRDDNGGPSSNNPAPVTNNPVPVDNTPIPGPSNDIANVDLDFLSEFANSDLATNADQENFFSTPRTPRFMHLCFP
ncbi:hypothetical protein BDM02DRAFT_3264580, partial [Thelephora ganbajun]